MEGCWVIWDIALSQTYSIVNMLYNNMCKTFQLNKYTLKRWRHNNLYLQLRSEASTASRTCPECFMGTLWTHVAVAYYLIVFCVFVWLHSMVILEVLVRYIIIYVIDIIDILSLRGKYILKLICKVFTKTEKLSKWLFKVSDIMTPDLWVHGCSTFWSHIVRSGPGLDRPPCAVTSASVTQRAPPDH